VKKSYPASATNLGERSKDLILVGIKKAPINIKAPKVSFGEVKFRAFNTIVLFN